MVGHFEVGGHPGRAHGAVRICTFWWAATREEHRVLSDFVLFEVGDHSGRAQGAVKIWTICLAADHGIPLAPIGPRPQWALGFRRHPRGFLDMAGSIPLEYEPDPSPIQTKISPAKVIL